MRRIKIVGYVTREFAHAETLERAKRWLIEVGFLPSRIEVHTHGTYRITVSVESGQFDEVQRMLDAVATADPEGASKLLGPHTSPSQRPQTRRAHRAGGGSAQLGNVRHHVATHRSVERSDANVD